MGNYNVREYSHDAASVESALVLVVDDDDSVRRALTRGLAAEGYCVETAAEARAALSAYQYHLPVAILSDMELPGISGLELFYELRRQYGRTLQFIGMSGSPKLLALAKAAGVESLLGRC